MVEERRKLRVLVITMGSTRQQQIENLFANMSDHFEMPIFSPGVPSRALRNRYEFFKVANEAGLLPEEEWEAIDKGQAEWTGELPTERFFDCLEGVPITREGRQGSRYDTELHYSVELWRKAKTLNRGRAVFACTLAHLIALKKFVRDGSFDLILEDNVRAPVESCADRVWESIAASNEWSKFDAACHFRFLGWLGSIPNLKWMIQIHSKKRSYPRANENSDVSVFPYPIPGNLEEDLRDMDDFFKDEQPKTDDTDDQDSQDKAEADDDNKKVHTRPGGTPVWGAYAYWMSKEAYERVLQKLRNDVGAMLWKGKRMRFYAVKPIDKILPRQVKSCFGAKSVQISTHPAFFRAPMLTSKIHSHWDPEFCKSTEYQLQNSGLTWSDLWLSDVEREIVEYYETSGEWITVGAWEKLRETK